MDNYLEDLLEMAIDEDESIEEYKDRYQSVSEGVLFKSEDGKKLTKEIREYCKKLRQDYKNKNSLGQRIVKNFQTSMKYGYNKEMLSKVVSFINSKLDAFWKGNVIQVTNYSNGIVYITYYMDVMGIYKNNLYRIHIVPDVAACGIGSVRETKLDKCIIPKELIETALKNNSGKDEFDITTNKIKNLDHDTLHKVMDICNKKYDDQLLAKIQFGRHIVFKRRK